MSGAGCRAATGVLRVGSAAVVIPADLADEVATEAVGMDALEGFVLLTVRTGMLLIGAYPPNDAMLDRFEAFRAGTYQPGQSQR